MIWLHGPTLQSSKIVPIAQITAVLARTPSLRHNINTSDLQRRFGPAHRLAVVILNGTYNSLPPDEGVNLTANVVVLLDVPDNRVLLLTD